MIQDLKQAHDIIRRIADQLDNKGPAVDQYLSKEEFEALHRLIYECDILVQAFGPQVNGVDPELDH